MRRALPELTLVRIESGPFWATEERSWDDVSMATDRMSSDLRSGRPASIKSPYIMS